MKNATIKGTSIRTTSEQWTEHNIPELNVECHNAKDKSELSMCLWMMLSYTYVLFFVNNQLWCDALYIVQVNSEHIILYINLW